MSSLVALGSFRFQVSGLLTNTDYTNLHEYVFRQKPEKQNFFSLLMKQKKMVNVIVEYNFFRFRNNIIEQEKMFF